MKNPTEPITELTENYRIPLRVLIPIILNVLDASEIQGTFGKTFLGGEN